MTSTKNDYYRNDPRNTPHDHEGNVIAGGPWLRAGEAESHSRWHYASNNGKMAIATIESDTPAGKASVFVTGWTGLNHDIIQSLKFDHGLYVPFSNGANPRTPHEVQFIKETNSLGKGDKIGSTPNLIKATGARYIEAGDSKIQTVPLVKDTRYLGTYNIAPTGIIGIVDVNGDQYVGRDDVGYEKRLKEHNYHREDTLVVPFAQGERLVPREHYSNHDLESVLPEWQKRPAYLAGIREMEKTLVGVGI